MTVRRRLALALLPFLALAASKPPGARGGNDAPVRPDLVGVRRPRLTVVISIDQFRGDYVRRFDGLLDHENGGFKRLLDAGSYFADARHDHFPLFTGPGHAAILTGGCPYKTGIVANDWFDRTAHKAVYCVDDATAALVSASPGGKARPVGPRNLRSTTIGDELKKAYGNSKVVSLSIKDRAAILLGGHAADTCLWLDLEGGRWITSTAYANVLPAWVNELNAKQFPASKLGSVWERPPGVVPGFKHPIGREPGAKSVKEFCLTPWGNDWVFDSALAAVDGESLGAESRKASDLLTINLATNDYVGHKYGPDSPEVAEITATTDRALARFLVELERRGLKLGESLLVVVTSDHGVAPVPPEREERSREIGGRLTPADVAKASCEALGVPIGTYVEPNFYLDEAAARREIDSGKVASRAALESLVSEKIAALEGVYACYTRTQILKGALPPTDIAQRVVRGFHPKVSGDVIVVCEPGWIIEDVDTASHGMPYIYDTHVPLFIAGPGIRRGAVFVDRVSILDVAPTLAFLLGVEMPGACDGVILKNAIERP
jgi:predicted AlkP superfamily pyrophosphatase or phosphodiesterase